MLYSNFERRLKRLEQATAHKDEAKEIQQVMESLKQLFKNTPPRQSQADDMTDCISKCKISVKNP
ncbi:TPA: hypothetical protein DDW35_13035 [Candidatus Sumerlaeota bacterium]|jgi:hypothetical protein|nr:hypothetical protein [Candidatus Sumerlaeota bacterium]